MPVGPSARSISTAHTHGAAEANQDAMRAAEARVLRYEQLQTGTALCRSDATSRHDIARRSGLDRQRPATLLRFLLLCACAHSNNHRSNLATPGVAEGRGMR